MATEIITAPSLDSTPAATGNGSVPRDVATEINYYNDPGDGSLPLPVFIGR